VLLTLLKRECQSTKRVFRSWYRSRWAITAIERQSVELNVLKRERWTEADMNALPAGEHDYFERKSGQLFSDTGELLGKLAKTVSAMANSGGGHIVLGVDDSGTPDGVPTMQGSTSTREWLEQKISHLVVYPLADFRVHVVEPSAQSRIPAGRQVIVIDIGDSTLAPHQCAHGGGDARKYVYYYRQAGRSEPAPHFYLELLRQRLVAPALTAELVALTPAKAGQVADEFFLAMRVGFLVKNTGRVAAYKWQLRMAEMSGHPAPRVADYRFRLADYPHGWSMSDGIRVDDTILPGCALREDLNLGLYLRPVSREYEAFRYEIETLLEPVTLGVQLATEVSPGQVEPIVLRSVVDVKQLAEFVMKEVSKRNC